MKLQDDKWRRRRKILTPAFHFNILKKYNEMLNEHGDKAVTDIISQGEETVQNLIDFCTDYTLNVICGNSNSCSHEKPHSTILFVNR